PRDAPGRPSGHARSQRCRTARPGGGTGDAARAVRERVAQGLRRRDPPRHDHGQRRCDRRSARHVRGLADARPEAGGRGAGGLPRGLRAAPSGVLGGEGPGRAVVPARAAWRDRHAGAAAGVRGGARAGAVRAARRRVSRHGQRRHLSALPRPRRRRRLGLRGASRDPDPDGGRAVSLGGRGRGGRRDGRGSAGLGRAGGRAAGPGPGPRRAGRRASREAGAGGKRDTGNGKRGPVRRGEARSRGASRRGPAQGPPRGGGGMSGAVATIGTFDGVHRGHQAVLAEIARRAGARGLQSVLITFDRHPLEVVNPPAAPRLLTLPEEKRDILTGLGLDRVEMLPFTPELAGRGRTIGIPTINLAPPDPRKLLPPDGVYAVWVDVGERETGSGKRYGGMMNQGPRPTFGVTARALEIHLFDFAGELYGEPVKV